MVYSNKAVMCVMHNGRILKELANGVVKLPFGAEYSLRFRNKNNRRAVVKIFIDGENVSGNGYIVPANDFVDIKRHHDVDRAFKFVELDSEEAHEHGKNGPNEDKVKGTIEARFYLEKEKPVYFPVKEVIHHHHHHTEHHHYPTPRPWYSPPAPQYTCDHIPHLSDGDTTTDFDPVERSVGLTSFGGVQRTNCNAGNADAKLSMGMTAPAPAPSDGDTATFKRISLNERRCRQKVELKDGCTVEGDTTGQMFRKEWIECEDTYTVLKVFLQGYEGEEEDEVEEVIEVKKTRKPRRKVFKDGPKDDIEAENDRLRRKIAELENEKLQKQLKELEEENS